MKTQKSRPRYATTKSGPGTKLPNADIYHFYPHSPSGNEHKYALHLFGQKCNLSRKKKQNFSKPALQLARLLTKTAATALALLVLLALSAVCQGHPVSALPMLAAVAGCNWCIGAYWSLGKIIEMR